MGYGPNQALIQKNESPHVKIHMGIPQYQPGQVNKTNTDKYKKIIWKDINFIATLLIYYFSEFLIF